MDGKFTSAPSLRGVTASVPSRRAPPALRRRSRLLQRAQCDGVACTAASPTISIPQRGGSKTPQRRDHERSAAFKRGQRFRAGIEGRISVLMRGRGMKRCRAEGAERFALFVAAAVLANNLMIIAALLTKRSARRRKATHGKQSDRRRTGMKTRRTPSPSPATTLAWRMPHPRRKPRDQEPEKFSKHNADLSPSSSQHN